MDADAKEATEAWFTILKAKGKYGRDKRVIETDEEALTDIIKKLVKKAGIETGNEQVRFHQLRVFLITRLSKIMEENRWKQVVGKKISEKAYVKPFQLREDFKRVIPLIGVSPQSSIGNEELKRLRREVAD